MTKCCRGRFPPQGLVKAVKLDAVTNPALETRELRPGDRTAALCSCLTGFEIHNLPFVTCLDPTASSGFEWVLHQVALGAPNVSEVKLGKSKHGPEIITIATGTGS